MNKRLFSLLLVLALVVSLLPVPAQAIVTYTRSGNLSKAKLTQAQIVALLHANPTTYEGETFVTQPSVTAPYAPGQVSSTALNATLNRLNALRTLAGLAPVKLNAALTQKAQYGPILLASSSFGHHPAKPADMDQAFYDKAHEATSNSNIAAGQAIVKSIDQFMDDPGSNNMYNVGHRQWQLSPALGQVGFGYATGGYYGSYTTEKVWDDSISTYSGGAGWKNIDFISWPASGNFPSGEGFFSSRVPWSCSLNPDKFTINSITQVTVSILRASDGAIWTMRGAEQSTAPTGTYLVKADTYGKNSLSLVFYPQNTGTLDGTYYVNISGVLDKKTGKAVNFDYQVDFFQLSDLYEYRDGYAATCYSQGYQGDAWCSCCDQAHYVGRGQNLPTTEHTPSSEPAYARPATCTAAGYTGDILCAEPNCRRTLTRGTRIEQLPHTPSGQREGARKATCGWVGYTGDLRCADCGRLMEASQQIPMLPEHTPADHLTSVIPATCTSFGYTGDLNCSVCNTTLEAGQFVDALGHSKSAAPTGVIAAACTTGGYTGDYLCARCGEVLQSGRSTSALGHSYGAWTTTVQPTLTATGSKFRTCHCGAQETAVIPKLSNPYRDVASLDYFYESVMWAAANNITAGITPTQFGPNRSCTRAQVVTFLWRAAGCPEPSGVSNPFHDVPASDYYYKAVLWAVEQGITAGISPTQFGPNRSCTRAQVVSFLWRCNGCPTPGASASPFADVSSNQYYYTPVLWAVEEGITSGVSPTRFGPNQTCTRAQVVSFLYRNET